MRSLWKGAISFGLVNIPVKLYAATERKDLKFNYLHETCHTPIRYRKWCPSCDREVGAEEIVWGYEYEKGKYVVLRDEDFERVPLSTTKTIDIIDFVNLEEIDPIFFDKTYYLEPAEGGFKAYSLLRRAMEETGRVAVAKVVIRTKESLAAIRVYRGSALAMETMFFPDEVRSAEELAGINEEPRLHDNEIKMAVSLIGSLSGHFEATRYENEYRKALRALVEEKIAGREVAEVTAPETTKVVDLMEALRASIRLAEEERLRRSERERAALRGS